MEIIQIVLTVIGSVIGSGAVFGFVQFLIQRSDNKKAQLKKNEHEELRKEFNKGLQEREDVGRKRYEEHKIAIEQMTKEHKKDFEILLKAIKNVEDSNEKLCEKVDTVADYQKNIGDGVMGLSHDKLIFSTGKIAERKAITLKEKATLTSIYDPYRRLGGNGDCKTAYEHVMSLNVISDEEAKRIDKELEGKKKE